MSTRLQILIASVVFCGLAGPVRAQDPEAAPPPANLAYVEGRVELVHDAVAEHADPPTMLVDGDIVRTANGRAEIVFADGTLLHLDSDAEIELLAPDHLRLLNGRALVRISHAAGRPYVIDTGAATVRLDASGEYLIAASDVRSSVEVAVARGHAEIDDGNGRAELRSGEMLTIAAAGARPAFQAFNAARWDGFARWSADRTRGLAASASAAQLPYELRPYAAVFDDHGRWDYVAPHGYVWFPAVGAAWRPYYDGGWHHTRYGWTWYGRDRWSWPTHHYGRWGFNGAFWYWIPAKVWGPAWVSWGFSPGYVSWCPLGWDGGPVIGFASGHSLYGPLNPWKSWTIVPREHFGYRRSVRAHAIDGGRLNDGVRRTMIVQHAPPPSPSGFAIARGSEPTPGDRGRVRQPGSDATRRGSVRAPASGNASGATAAATATATTNDPRDAAAAQSGAPSRRGNGDARGQRRAPGYAPPSATPRDDAGASGAGAVERQDDDSRVIGARRGAGGAGQDERRDPTVYHPPASRRGADRGAGQDQRRDPTVYRPPASGRGADRGAEPRENGPAADRPRAGAPRSAAPRDESPRSQPSSAGGAQRRGGSGGTAATAPAAPAPAAPRGGAVRRPPRN